MLSVYFSMYDFISYYYCYYYCFCCACLKIFFVCRLLSLCLQLFLHLFKIHKTVVDICQPSYHPSPSPAIIYFATSLFYTIFHTLQPDVGIPCSLPSLHCAVINTIIITKISAVVVEWLVFLLHVNTVLGSNLGLDTCYPDLRAVVVF